ncbi:MAG: Na/Pi cotransporter family protein [Clostridiales bacterium]|nr:Na/Pi cotransporter family protein [Candidatus Coliplasma equi]
MGIIEIITLIGGVAFFLYGMNVMSGGLAKMSGGKLEATLKRMTSNYFMGLLLGAGITVVLQSSSAMTVMLVGLVNSGIMEISQTVGVIMGAHVGTTLTGWLLSLVGLESDNTFLKLLKPEVFSLVFALFGVLMIMGKNKKRKDIGNILVGFAVLMYGMVLMSSSVSSLKDSESFVSMLTAFDNPFLSIAAGAVFTGIIQSSAAGVGILQALSLTGAISYKAAIPLILGMNIGTCVTSIISSFGVSKNAKKVSVIHIVSNLVGATVGLLLFYGAHAIFDFGFIENAVNPFTIALIHTAFNIFNTILWTPFRKPLVSIANLIIRGKDKSESVVFAPDERLLATPSVAVSESFIAAGEMAKKAKDAIFKSLEILSDYDAKKAEEITEQENVIDTYEDKLGTYLVKVSSHDLSVKDSQIVANMLHSIGDFERIGDHACNLLKTATEIHEKKIKFSDEAIKEIETVKAALYEILDITVEAFEKRDVKLAMKVEPLEQVIDMLTDTVKSNHISRLQSGNCTIELGFVLSDIITNFERVSDHCSNVAVAVIESFEGAFGTHEYLGAVKAGENERYRTDFENFSAKYAISQQ